MPAESVYKEKTLTERNFIGYSHFHIFVNDETGEEFPVECTEAEYVRLAGVDGGQFNPTLEGHTWKYSMGGAIKVDTTTGLMADGDYVVVDNKAYVTAKEAYCGGLVVAPEAIIASKITIEVKK